MSEPRNQSTTDPIYVAYQQGRRLGLATGALALSIVAFVNLLGIEKSVLAGVLALLSLHSAGPVVSVVRRGRAALAIAAVHAVTVIAVLVLFRDKLTRLIHLLMNLS
jgi:hypothetical protein